MDMKSSEEVLVIYEIKVPSRRSNPKNAQKSIDLIVSKIKENSDYINFINAPEIIEENFEGKPFYKSVDVVSLGHKLNQSTGKEIIINSVVGHFKNKDKFIDYLKNTKKTGIQNIVLVGVANPKNSYPGPTIGEANKIASELGINVGNICIPHREDEIKRMIDKTKNGCSFFTTQLLFEDKETKHLLLDYDKACKMNGIQPSRIFLSFATLEDDYDIEFFKWLGVEISKKTEDEMRKSKDMKKYTADIIKTIYSSILKFKEENKINVPLGLNIAQINVRNLDASLKLIRDLHELSRSG